MKHTILKLDREEIQSLVAMLSSKSAGKLLLRMQVNCSFNRTTATHKLTIKRKRTFKELLPLWLK